MKIEKRRKIKKLVIFISIIALIALIISILYFYFYKNTKFYLKEELFETQINNTYDLTDNIKLSNLKIEELKIIAGKRFFDKNLQDIFPERDFYLATEVNTFNFVLKVEKDQDGMNYIKRIDIN